MHYFISDIHLGIHNRKIDIEREDILLLFLSKIQNDAQVLYIIGDLFDYWFEYKTVIPKYYYRTLSALYDLNKVCKVEYLMGNHDFGHRNFFEEELGIPIYKDDIEREINGKKFFISHGDGKAQKDLGYLILKKIVRSPISLNIFRWIHPDIGIAMASSSSRASRSYTDAKDYGPSEGLELFAEKKIQEGYDYVVMGHRHYAQIKEFPGGKYINPGDWLHKPTYASFDGQEMKLDFVENLISK